MMGAGGLALNLKTFLLAGALGAACLGLQSVVANAAGAPQVGPAPAWVHPAPPIPPEKPDVAGLPFVMRLNDVQLSLDADGWTEFHEIQAKVQAPAGLQALGAIPFQWSPWSDTITFHHARIVRDGQSIDILPKDGGFTVLRRETGLEQAMLTGALTAVLQPEGLQVGDTVDIAVSIRHADPLLKGRTGALVSGWDLAPVSRFRLEARWPSALPVRWRETAGLAPLHKTDAAGVTTATLDLEDVRAPVLPAHAPPRYLHGREVEFTTVADWKDVTQVMAPLFAKAAQLGPDSAVAAQARQIAKTSADPKVRAAAALKLVQGQVRYLAHADGDGGYTPQTADETWRLRYGDCKAKTALLLALLHELGVPAEPVLANIGAGDGLDAHLPSLTLFNHVLVRARIDGKDYWLDGAREGDRNLDDLVTPAYGWVLPIDAADGKLVRLTAEPAKQPQVLQVIRYDATGGVTAPEPSRFETTFRGDAATVLHAQLSAVPPDRLDAALKQYWAGVHNAFTAIHVAAAWDPATGEEKLTADGTSKLDWSNPGLELQHVALGGAPDIKRDPAASEPDAPYVVEFPAYIETDESVVLPPGDVVDLQNAKATDVDKVIAGIAYRRTTTLAGNVLQVVSTTRALQPEISAADARASVDPLKRLGEQAVYAPAGNHADVANDAATLDSHPNTFEGHRDRGTVLLQKKRYREALAEYDAAIQQSPKSQDGWAGRAIAKAWLADRTALDDADKTDTLGKPSTVAARARAILAQMNGDTEGARAGYKHVLALTPGDDFALERLIYIEIAARNFEAARADLDSLVRAHPENAGDNHLLRARIIWVEHHDAAAAKVEIAQAPTETADDLLRRAYAYNMVEDSDHARADADAALHLEPSAEAWLARATADGGYVSATSQADADEALKLDPTNEAAELWKVNGAIQHQDYAGALPLMDRLTKDHPAEEGGYTAVRAMIEGRLNQTERMDADFERAHQIQGAAASPTNMLCTWEVEARWRPESALADCDKALQQSPKAQNMQLERLVLLHRLGRDTEATKALDAIEADAKQMSGSLNNICYTLAVQPFLLDRALADCDASLKLDPDNAATLDSRAFVLMRLGRDAEALSTYDAALKAFPKLPTSLYGRGLIEARQGRAADSKRDIAAALQLSPGVVDDFDRMGVPAHEAAGHAKLKAAPKADTR
jgi:tetratricopeptide (TPR) repeat protein/transglutaminase-like putative cysteine protease